MEITEEQINQLDQLTRIEFRQKYYFLESQKRIGGLAFMILIISMMFAPIKAFYIFVFPILIAGVYIFYRNPKYKRQLYNEYFEIKIQRVKRNERRNKK